jgi:hypothetical protein
LALGTQEEHGNGVDGNRKRDRGVVSRRPLAAMAVELATAVLLEQPITTMRRGGKGG